MIRAWRLALASLLAFASPVAARAGAPYPRVQVVAEFHGDIFTTVPAFELDRLKKELEAQVRKAAPKIAPCMEWITSESGAEARAQIHIELNQMQSGNFWRVELAFVGEIGKNKSAPFWKIDSGLSPLHWHPNNPVKWEEQRVKLLRTVDSQFSDHAQELRKALDSNFIANIPIADRVDVRTGAQRIEVPLSARRLDLEPGTLLTLKLKAALCTRDPGECRIGLKSDGDFEEWLRCQISGSSCCAELSLNPDLEDRVKKAISIQVYLAGDHRHCLYGPDHCPGPGGLFQHP